MTGEIIDMQEWVEREAMEPSPRSIRKRLAEITIDIMFLETERARLERLL